MSLSKPLNFYYSEPVKRIHDGTALHAFQQSIALKDVTVVLTKIAKLVEDKDVPVGVLSKSDLYSIDEIEKYEHDTKLPFTPIEDTSNDQLNQIYLNKPIVKSIVKLLLNISKLIDEIPPLEGPRRYGNFACRTWHDELNEKMDDWLLTLIIDNFYKLENPQGFLIEIRWYISNSFGSRERLDYGTGHELNFLAFLTGLLKVDIMNFNYLDGYDFLTIFGVYYNVTRKLITTYTLEPAGSHGVWGLDDHFHLIYILGSSQMLNSNNIDSHNIPPKYTQNRSIIYQYSTKNLYFNAIAFIFKVKKGPFFEHSPILYDVSNVKNWEKIVKGMFKMFQAEVVGKFPVVQHFYFGGVLFPWLNSITLKPLPISITDDNLEVEEKEQKIETMNKYNDEKTPTPSINEPITTVPWKSKKPGESLQDRILNKNININSRGPTIHSTPPPDLQITRAPWAKK